MNAMIAGRIMEIGMMMNRFEGIEVYVMLHGNTGCLCVQITEDKTQSYENRAFASNEAAMLEIKRDMVKMHQELVKSGRMYR